MQGFFFSPHLSQLLSSIQHNWSFPPPPSFFFPSILIHELIFLALQGLHCFLWTCSGCGERGLLFVMVHRLLVEVASLVERGLWSGASVVAVHSFSCSTACEIFLDQGLNPRPLHWQADSYPLDHQRSPNPPSFLKPIFHIAFKIPHSLPFPSLVVPSQPLQVVPNPNL